MKTLITITALLGFAALPATAATTSVASGLNKLAPVFAQKDCKEGEKWNEDTQKCEAKSG